MPTKNKPGPTASTVVTRPSLRTHVHNTIAQPCGKPKKGQYSGAQHRALSSLLTSPQGVRSFELQREAYTMYPSRVIRRLRACGLSIETQLEPYINLDGRQIRIGRYILDPGSRSRALALLQQMRAQAPNRSVVQSIRTISRSMTARY